MDLPFSFVAPGGESHADFESGIAWCWEKDFQGRENDGHIFPQSILENENIDGRIAKLVKKQLKPPYTLLHRFQLTDEKVVIAQTQPIFEAVLPDFDWKPLLSTFLLVHGDGSISFITVAPQGQIDLCSAFIENIRSTMDTAHLSDTALQQFKPSVARQIYIFADVPKAVGETEFNTRYATTCKIQLIFKEAYETDSWLLECGVAAETNYQRYLDVVRCIYGLWCMEINVGPTPSSAGRLCIRPPNTNFETVADLVSVAVQYLNDLCPDWNGSRKLVYMLPPIFEHTYAEPQGLASGAAKHLNFKVHDKIRCDETEGRVFQRLEAVGWDLDGPMIVLHNFLVDDSKREVLKRIFPWVDKNGLEADFLVLSKRSGIAIVEVKGIHRGTASRTIERKFQEARNQCQKDAAFLADLAQALGCELPPETALQVLAFPLLEYEYLKQILPDRLEKFESIGGAVCCQEKLSSTDEFSTWLANKFVTKPGKPFKLNQEQLADFGKSLNITNAEHMIKLLEDVGRKPRLDCKISEKVYESLAPVLTAIWGLQPKEDNFSPATKSQYINEESDRVLEHRIIKDPEKKKPKSGIISTANKAPLFCELKQRIFFLTPEQLEVWNGEPVQIICGPAGTGKTILLMGKLAEKAKQDLHWRRRQSKTVIVLAPYPMDEKYKQFSIDNNVNERVLCFNDRSVFDQLTQLKAHLTSRQLDPIGYVFEKWRQAVHAFLIYKCQTNDELESIRKELVQIRQSLNWDSLIDDIIDTGLDAEKRDVIYEEMASVFQGKVILIDDALCHRHLNLVFVIFGLLGRLFLTSRQPIMCWAAYDIQQIFVLSQKMVRERDKLVRNLMEGCGKSEKKQKKDLFVMIRNELQAIMRKLYMQSLHALLPPLAKQAHLSASKKYLGTVLRSCVNVFDCWHAELENLNNPGDKPTVIGHRIMGLGVRSYSVKERTAKAVALEIDYQLKLLTHQYQYQKRRLHPRHCAVIFSSESMSWKEPIEQELRALSWNVTHIHGQQSTPLDENLLAVDGVGNCVSLEWPVVIYVTDLGTVYFSTYEENAALHGITETAATAMEGANESRIDDYIALSRCVCGMVWLHISEGENDKNDDHEDNDGSDEQI